MLSPTNPLGIKAGGEGGTTAAPAAVVSALLDALARHGRARTADAGHALCDLERDPEGARRVPARGSGPGFMTPPILALERISKRFGAIVIAADLDLALGEGEALGIIGPNGAGKTTLFGIISGTIAPDAGRVLYRGADITGLPPARRCTMGIGRSFQIPQPFVGMSVFENLVVAAAFGARRHERDAYASCMAILERCGLADKANRPAGSLALLDRKRLELARALATEPAVLLLDEVAGGLTERECHALIELIRDVRTGGVSIIWIEHVVHALIASIDRLVVLHNGAIIAAGDPATVIRSPEVAEIYLGIEADA